MGDDPLRFPSRLYCHNWVGSWHPPEYGWKEMGETRYGGKVGRPGGSEANLPNLRRGKTLWKKRRQKNSNGGAAKPGKKLSNFVVGIKTQGMKTVMKASAMRT